MSLRVCPFRPCQTLAGCTNPAMIAVQYLQNLDLNNLLIYTVQQFVKITAFTKKNDPPNGIQNYSARSRISSRQTPQSCSLRAKMPFQSKVGPQYRSPLSLVLLLIYIWLIFTFFTFSFPCIFYSVFCFRTWHFPLFWLAVIAFALSFRSSLWLWIGKEPEEVWTASLLQACVILCIVSACEHTNIIGHCDDILLMAFWYAIVNKKRGRRNLEKSVAHVPLKHSHASKWSAWKIVLFRMRLMLHIKDHAATSPGT